MNLQIFRSIAVLLLVFGLGACSPPAEKPRAGAPTGGDFVLQGPQGAVDSKALRGKLRYGQELLIDGLTKYAAGGEIRVPFAPEGAE